MLKRRVNLDGHSLSSFSAALVYPYSPDEQTDLAWIDELLAFEVRDPEILKRSQVYAHFSERGLISPFTRQIVQIADVVNEFTEPSLQQPQHKPATNLIDLVLSATLPLIESIARRSVILEVNLASLREELDGENPSERFASFVSKYEKQSERLKFHCDNPVLSRAVRERLAKSSCFFRELFTRLNSDRDKIKNSFGPGIDLKLLRGITLGGDTHNEGCSVAILEFESGVRLVYKPRSVSMESHFQTLIEFFNDRLHQIQLRTMKVLDRETYGWVEFIEARKADNSISVRNYHKRLGALVCMAHCLNGVDFFFENVVCDGDSPVLVDLETLFHTSIETGHQTSAEKNALREINDSVLGMGVLPQPTLGGEPGTVFDISAIGARKDIKAPYSVTGVENFGRDDIRISSIRGWIPAANSAPSVEYGDQSHMEAFLDGFLLASKCVIKNKSQLLAPGGPIAPFKEAIRRQIVRDTKVYGSLQADEFHPDLIKDQIDRQWHWDNLWTDIHDRPEVDRFIASELKQVFSGDIPYFYGQCDARYVADHFGNKIDLSDLQARSPYSAVVKKLNEFNDNTVQKQCSLIAESLGIIKASDVNTVLSQADWSDDLSFCRSVGDMLLNRCVQANDEAWLYQPQNPFSAASSYPFNRVAPVDTSLYDGASGIALFLGSVYSLTDEHKYQKSAIRIARAILRKIMKRPHSTSSGFVGAASELYALSALNHLDCFPTEFNFASIKLKLFDEAHAALEPNAELDLLLGLSGTSVAVLSVSKMETISGVDEFLNESLVTLSTSAEAILENQKVDGFLSVARGFSHGISGLALAIYKLSEASTHAEGIEIARELLKLERRIVKKSGWTDSHIYNEAPLAAWCHGAPGIAYAISKMPQAQNDVEVATYLSEALEVSIKTGLYDSKCLCHGSAGNLEIMRELVRSNVTTMSCRNYISSLERACATSGFSSFGSDQSMGFGLMTGVTGLAYMKLRHIDEHALIPDIMSLQPVGV